MGGTPAQFPARAGGALITDVSPGQIAADAGIKPGDRLMAVDGRPLRDILDYQYRTHPAQICLRLVTAAGGEWELEIEKDEVEPLGLVLADELFDGVRECANDCFFCFVHQLPPGLRRSLYQRDDDLRLSVLHGNFVTLTDLGAADWARLREQRLGPLHVSIHTTDDRLRREMMGNPAAPPILDQLRRVLALGITVHGQIVLVPGANDGPALDRTLGDLLALAPGLASLGVVPVGLTKHSPPRLKPFGPQAARRVLAGLRRWQKRFAAAGRTGLYAADEWYLGGGGSLPAGGEYDDYPQLANGIGMARRFIERYGEATRSLPAALPGRRRVLVATGRLFAPVLDGLVKASLGRVSGLDVTVLGCRNELFGATVTVAGLLGGADLARAAAPQAAGADLLIVPAGAFRAAGDLMLDDWSRERLQAALGLPVAVAAGPAELVRLALGDDAAPGAKGAVS